MSRSLNSVTLLGRLTRDPEIRATSTGQTVCRFGLALNRVYFNRDTQEKIEKVTFVDITAWGNLAENVSQYCTKGKQVLVQGRLESSSWEQDGQTRSKLEVVARDVIFTQDGRSGDFNGNTSGYSDEVVDKPTPKTGKKPTGKKTAKEPEEINIDDVPF